MSCFDVMAGALASSKDENILIYCQTHNRSSRVSWTLYEQGFGNLKVLRDGISGWARAGYELER